MRYETQSFYDHDIRALEQRRQSREQALAWSVGLLLTVGLLFEWWLIGAMGV